MARISRSTSCVSSVPGTSTSRGGAVRLLAAAPPSPRAASGAGPRSRRAASSCSPNARSPPSSWLEEVRNTSGQRGHGLSAARVVGGAGISSTCVTLAAPWRSAVPRQSEPVSPPPRITTRLPAAFSRGSSVRQPRDHPVLVLQVVHRLHHAGQLAPRHLELPSAAARRWPAPPRHAARAARGSPGSCPRPRPCGTPRPRPPSARAADRAPPSPS